MSEDILLRDVIDLEATFGDQLGEDGEEPVINTAAVSDAQPKAQEAPELDADGNPIINDDDDDDEDEDLDNALTLATLCANLREGWQASPWR